MARSKIATSSMFLSTDRLWKLEEHPVCLGDVANECCHTLSHNQTRFLLQKWGAPDGTRIFLGWFLVAMWGERFLKPSVDEMGTYQVLACVGGHAVRVREGPRKT